MELVPESESRARAERVLPSIPSEDASHLLKAPVAGAPEQDTEPVEPHPDYLPDPLLEARFDISLPGDTPKAVIIEAFSAQWRQKYPGMVYGHSPQTGRWTFVEAADVPDRFDSLKYAVSLVRTWDPGAEAIDANRLRDYERQLTKISRRLGGSVSCEESPEDLARRAERLFLLWNTCDRDVIVVLAAPEAKSYDGRDIWDVMLALGLRWGDGDLFHWEHESDQGSDFFFSVWTATDPGYFFPEEIAADRVATEDLIFGFSIPRSTAPIEVFEQMMNAVRYAQQRLGGTILNGNGEPLNERLLKRDIDNVVGTLYAHRLKPGQETTLKLF
jgi:cell division protein ZipA